MNQRCVTADFSARNCPSNAAGVECNGQGVSVGGEGLVWEVRGEG